VQADTCPCGMPCPPASLCAVWDSSKAKAGHQQPRPHTQPNTEDTPLPVFVLLGLLDNLRLKSFRQLFKRVIMGFFQNFAA